MPPHRDSYAVRSPIPSARTPAVRATALAWTTTGSRFGWGETCWEQDSGECLRDQREDHEDACV